MENELSALDSIMLALFAVIGFLIVWKGTAPVEPKDPKAKGGGWPE